MKNKLESRSFFVRDYSDGQDMISDIASYAKECKEKYPNGCTTRTITTRDDFGVGIEVIVEEQIREETKNVGGEEKGEER